MFKNAHIIFLNSNIIIISFAHSISQASCLTMGLKEVETYEENRAIPLFDTPGMAGDAAGIEQAARQADYPGDTDAVDEIIMKMAG